MGGGGGREGVKKQSDVAVIDSQLSAGVMVGGPYSARIMSHLSLDAPPVSDPAWLPGQEPLRYLYLYL